MAADATGRLPAGTPVGVAGAGTMGAGIAQVAVLAGHPVLLFDTRPGAAQAAVASVHTYLAKLRAKGLVTGEQVTYAQRNLCAVTCLREFAPCGLVIEAILEDLRAKQALFRELEMTLPPGALLATNTSSLSITSIAAGLRSPERLAGMHFFNPAPLMPLVEVVSGAVTALRIAETLHATATAWGKVPVHARSSPGFIVNRVARPFYAEALRILEEGAADCATIDAVMREAGGFRMGPFELMDLIGNDVNYAVTRSVFEAFYGDPRFKPSQRQLELVEAGFLGRKTGRGFFRYDEGAPTPPVSTHSPVPPPQRVRLFGASVLGERFASCDLLVEREAAHADGRIAQCGDCVLYCSDGRSATVRAADTGVSNTLLLDLALHPKNTPRLAVSVADGCDPNTIAGGVGLLQAAGIAVSLIDDIPGLIVLRTVAMLANEASDAVLHGVTDAKDCDMALRKGVNYPCGPLEWAEELGLSHVVAVLDHLAAWYGEGRYRVSPLLRRKALARGRFTSGDDHA